MDLPAPAESTISYVLPFSFFSVFLAFSVFYFLSSWWRSDCMRTLSVGSTFFYFIFSLRALMLYL